LEFSFEQANEHDICFSKPYGLFWCHLVSFLELLKGEVLLDLELSVLCVAKLHEHVALDVVVEEELGEEEGLLVVDVGVEIELIGQVKNGSCLLEGSFP